MKAYCQQLMKLFSRRRVIACTIFLLIILAIIPFDIVQAGLGDIVGGAIKNAVNPVLNVVFGFFATILEGIFKLIAGFLMLIINYFMGLHVTPDPRLNTPQFVIQGWNFSRQLINIFFILILVFIGLATILRIQSYQLQKTLPLLVIIALLVNFSGVFVGFIVDMGTIFAKFFLDKVQGGWEFSGINFTASFTGQIARILFYPIATLIFFIVMLLFAVRTMVLWTLTILAPLAFGAYILPGTKKYWSQWLGQLIQWSIIGVPISFFMYLSKAALDAGAVGDAGSLGAQLAGFIAPFTALFLLVIGVMLSMQLAPAGASTVIAKGKKWGKGAGKLAGTAAWRRIGSGIEKAGTRLREGAEKQPLVPAGANLLRRTAARTGGFGTRTLAKWAGRGIETGSRKLTAQMHTTDDAQIGAAEKNATNKDPNDNINNFVTAVGRKDWNAATGILATTMDKNGDTDEIRKAADSGKIRWEDINTTFKHAQKHGNPTYFRPILKGFLDKMQDGTLEASEGNQASIWEKLKARDITDEVVDIKSLMEKDPEAGEKVLDEIFLKADSNVTTALMRHPKKVVRDWAVKHAESKGEDWFINNKREDTLNTIISSGGRTMGVPVFGGLNRGDVTRKVMMRDAGNSAQGLREEMAQLALRKDDPATTNKRGLTQQIEAIEKALEYKERSLTQLQTKQTGAQGDLQIAQKEITRLEKEEKALQQKGQQLTTADKIILTNNYKAKAGTQQILERIGEELSTRGGRPATPRPRGIPAQQAKLLSSSGPIGKTYQDWTHHQQTAQRIDNELQAIESGIQAIKNDSQRRRALDRFTEIGTIAGGEAKAAKTIKETIRKQLPTLRNLPNDKRAESMRPFEVPSDQSTRLQQAQRDLENLKKIAKAGAKEKRLESEP